MKLLIVDDHAGVRNMIRQLTARPDDTVRECASGESALDIARSFAPDWMTLDLMLPGLPGLDTARAFRTAHPQTRVVIVSSYDDPELRQTARDAGVVGYVVKDNLGELQSLFAVTRTATVAPADRTGTWEI